MTSRRLVILPVLALCLARPSGAQDTTDALFARWASRESPGCAVGVAKEGRTVLSRAYGMADLERDVPITASTVFEAGSVAKQFAAAAILLLVEDRKLSLADDVRKHVPELPDYGATVTVEHLLTHTSGLREAQTVASLGGWSPVTGADFLDIVLRQQGLNHTPGTQFSYVGTGFALVSTIVGRVTGRSLADFSRERLFEPLGMRSTRWRDNYRAVVKGRAIAYQPVTNGFVQSMPMENFYGHGGLLTTVGDMLLWNEALASDRLPPSVPKSLRQEARLTGGQLTGYGRGLFLDRYKGHAQLHHDGGHGGYRAWLGRFPDARVSVALLCNTVVPNVVTLGQQVANAFLPVAAVQTQPAARGAGATAAPVSHALTSQEAARYAGVFISDERGLAFEVTADGVKLSGDRSPLEMVSSSEFLTRGAKGRFESPDIIRISKPDGREPQTLRRVDARKPTPEDLRALTGRYTSSEAVGTYDAGIEGGGLVLRLEGRPGYVHRLVPIAWDIFSGSGMIIRFHRDAAGRVESVGFSLSRVRDLRFASTSPPRAAK